MVFYVGLGGYPGDGGGSGGGYTWLDRTNPCNGSGTLTYAEFWFMTGTASGVRIGTFTKDAGGTYDYWCHASWYIGTVIGGSKQTFSGLSLAASVNDIIGMYYTSGTHYFYYNHGAGNLYYIGDLTSSLVAGNDAIVRPNTGAGGFTYIDVNNPVSTAPSKITTFEFYFAQASLGSVAVGIFTNNGGGNFTCTYSLSLGPVSGLSKQTFTGFDFVVSVGQCIGVYGLGTYFVYANTAIGYTGVYTLSGNHCTDEGAVGGYSAAQWIISFKGHNNLCRYALDNATNGICFSAASEPYSPPLSPTVTTQAGSSITKYTFTANGNITSIGSANCTRRGFCYKVGTSGDPTIADSIAYDDGDFGAGAYTKGISGLAAGTGYRVRAYAVNAGGLSYGTSVTVTTTGVVHNTQVVKPLLGVKSKRRKALRKIAHKPLLGLKTSKKKRIRKVSRKPLLGLLSKRRKAFKKSKRVVLLGIKVIKRTKALRKIRIAKEGFLAKRKKFLRRRVTPRLGFLSVIAQRSRKKLYFYPLLGLKSKFALHGTRKRKISSRLGLYFSRFALLFTSSIDSYINVGHASSLSPTEAVSIEAWIQPASATGVHGIVGDSQDWSTRYHLYQTGTQVKFGITNTVAIQGGFVGAGSRCHVVGTYSKALQIMKLYVQGVEVASGYADSSVATSIQDLWVGKSGGLDAPVIFDGLIDEVRIYSRALTPTEVSQHFLGHFLDDSGLIGCWHFEEGAGATTLDSSGNGNTGAITGATWATISFHQQALLLKMKRGFTSRLGALGKTRRSVKRAIPILLGLLPLRVKRLVEKRKSGVSEGLKSTRERRLNLKRPRSVKEGLSLSFRRFYPKAKSWGVKVGLASTRIRRAMLRRILRPIPSLGLAWLAIHTSFISGIVHYYMWLTSSMKFAAVPRKRRGFRRTSSTRLGTLSLRQRTPGYHRRLTLPRIGLVSSRIQRRIRKFRLTAVGLLSLRTNRRTFRRKILSSFGETALRGRKALHTYRRASLGEISRWRKDYSFRRKTQLGLLVSLRRIAKIFRKLFKPIMSFSAQFSRRMSRVRVGKVLLGIKPILGARMLLFIFRVPLGLASLVRRRTLRGRSFITSFGLGNVLTGLKAYFAPAFIAIQGFNARLQRYVGGPPKIFTISLGLVSTLDRLGGWLKSYPLIQSLSLSMTSQRTFGRAFTTSTKIVTTLWKYSKALGYKTLKFFRQSWTYHE